MARAYPIPQVGSAQSGLVECEQPTSAPKPTSFVGNVVGTIEARDPFASSGRKGRAERCLRCFVSSNTWIDAGRRDPAGVERLTYTLNQKDASKNHAVTERTRYSSAAEDAFYSRPAPVLTFIPSGALGFRVSAAQAIV